MQFKKIRNIIILFALFISLLLIKESNSFLTQKPFTYLEKNNLNNSDEITWTIMVYLDGDNNLEKYAIESLNDMEFGYKETTNVKIIVLLDRHIGFDTSNGDWTNTRLYEISPDKTNQINSVLLEDWGERNLANYLTLKDFVGYCFANYPAENYMLTLFNHGGGINGICEDADPEYSNLLGINEVKSAILQNEIEYTTKIDILSFLACTMNTVEVAYELRNVSSYFIAEQNTGWGEGIDWNLLIDSLINNPFMQPFKLCDVFIDVFSKSEISLKCPTTCSVIDLEKLENISLYIQHFTNNITQISSLEHLDLLTDLLLDVRIFDEKYIDFVHFLEQICDSNILQTDYMDICNSASNLKYQLKSTILWNYCDKVFRSTANGLSIYFPFPKTLFVDSYDSKNLDFINEFSWKFFLDKYKSDNDGDGLADWFEFKYSNDISTLNPYEDIDGDNLTNNFEYWYGSNPTIIDTDFDKLDDRIEIFEIFSKPYEKDSDLDGYTDWEEFSIFKTDPLEFQDKPVFRWYPYLVPISINILLLPIIAAIFKRLERKNT